MWGVFKVAKLKIVKKNQTTVLTENKPHGFGDF